MSWSLTLRAAHRLRLFKNMLRRIFVHKRKEAMKGWRR
jgi:hypothetical protein